MKKPYQLGDILIFKAEDDALSKCIAYLTNSDVSHSAMFYKEDTIIETIAPGVVTHKYEIGKGEAAYLLRLTPPLDSQPLMDAAQKYLDAKTHYNFPALLYLAGLLLFRRIRPTNKLLSVIEQIMTLGCLELDKILQKLAKHPENRSMVCSQFVYQVYYDCGNDYQIRIHSGAADSIEQESDSIRLYDLYNENAICKSKSAHIHHKVSKSPEELITQLCTALNQSGETNAVSTENSRIQPIIDKFCDKLKKLMDILDADMPIDSLFVSPADFVYRSENLDNMGEILIERII